MQIIPISEEEQSAIDKNLAASKNTSFVASVMLFSVSPLISPKRRDSLSIAEANFKKQELIDRLQAISEHAGEQENKYNVLQNKIHKFNLG